MKNLTYFIVGGHGGQAFVNLWLNDKFNHNLVFNVVDWGGHSGLMGRILLDEHFNYLPIGDLRNNLAIISRLRFNSNGINLENLLQEQVSNLDEIDLKINEIFALLSEINDKKINLDISKIYKFTDIYKKRYKRADNRIKYKFDEGKRIKLKHKIGNIFLTAIAYSIDSDNGFKLLNDKLQELNLLPSNINISFIEDKRYIQKVVKTRFGQLETLADGEDMIDELQIPIDLESFSIIDPLTNLPIVSKNSSIVKLIDNSDLILIPPGSESNSYPWIFFYASELKSKEIIRISNIWVESKSYGVGHEIALLDKYKIYPKFFIAKIDEKDKKKYLKALGRYGLENKKLQSSNIEDIKNQITFFNPNCDIKKLESNLKINMDVLYFNGQSIKNRLPRDVSVLEQGFRHDREQINNVISNLYSK